MLYQSIFKTTSEWPQWMTHKFQKVQNESLRYSFTSLAALFVQLSFYHWEQCILTRRFRCLQTMCKSLLTNMSKDRARNKGIKIRHLITRLIQTWAEIVHRQDFEVEFTLPVWWFVRFVLTALVIKQTLNQ